MFSFGGGNIRSLIFLLSQEFLSNIIMSDITLIMDSLDGYLPQILLVNLIFWPNTTFTANKAIDPLFYVL